MKKKIEKNIKIALVGNPNSGKTTLFNLLTGSRQHVGNWPGVTVEKKEGSFNYNGITYELIDLPGIYGLLPNSLEEKIARDYIIQQKPDLIINIIDGTALERSLYLTTQLIDCHSRMILVINMYDEVVDKGISIDIEKLKLLLKFPVVTIVATKEKGIKELLETIEANLSQNPSERIHINYSEDIEKAIKDIECEILCESEIGYFSRWISIQLLSGDDKILENISKENANDRLMKKVEYYREELKKLYKEDINDVFNDYRLGFINGIVKECVKIKTKKIRVDITGSLDKLLLNKYLSFPIFGLILWATFQLTFYLGGIFTGWIENFVGIISTSLSSFISDGMLKSLLIDGIISGVGGVLVFLPQITILFLIIAILEDSGYMARIAFIMDRIMHFLGLHGKSFISLFMGFGCNVSGIMATRTLENEDDRKITALINPFMSCSARLPVYVLITGMFFPKNGGTIIAILYFTGIFVSVFTAKILKIFFFKKESVPFVMELPPYRMPTLKSLLIHTWERASIFLKKMGGVILVGSIIIWTLGYFPRVKEFPDEIRKMELMLENQNNENEKKAALEKIEGLKNSYQFENSYIGRLGRFLQPFFKPLGFSWRESVSLLTGFFAKEVVVSTISVLYNTSEEASEELKVKMESNGMKKSNALAFLVFVLLYIPCIATIAAIFRETNSLKWTLFSIFYGIFIGYVFALIFKFAGDMLFIFV